MDKDFGWVAELERLRAENGQLTRLHRGYEELIEKLEAENKELLAVCKLMAAVKDSDDLSGMLRANRAAKAAIARCKK